MKPGGLLDKKKVCSTSVALLWYIMNLIFNEVYKHGQESDSDEYWGESLVQLVHWLFWENQPHDEPEKNGDIERTTMPLNILMLFGKDVTSWRGK